MRERHARADRLSGDEDPPARPQPRAPAQPRSNDTRPVRNLGGSGRGDSGSPAEPWAPAWTPESTLRAENDFDFDAPPPAPQRPAPPEVGPRKSRQSEKLADEQPTGKGTRVRGPAEVRSARDKAEDDDELPRGAQSADFKTLQAMIARGIQDAETGATKLEADVPLRHCEDDEERRYRERQRQRREQEAEQREKEREKAREKRRREMEERQRRQIEELEREEQEILRQREEKTQSEAQCRREFAAATRIQARIRGRRLRAGKQHSTLGLRATIHTTPWRETLFANNQCLG